MSTQPQPDHSDRKPVERPVAEAEKPVMPQIIFQDTDQSAIAVSGVGQVEAIPDSLPAPARYARPIPHSTNRTKVASTAFMAILQRDLLVTRREFATFLFQMLLQPLFFLFIFGKVLPQIGIAEHGFGALLLPGIVALTIVTTAIQGVALPLVIDLGYAHEIDDRLLAPLPISMVAIEKILFATVRGLIAGAVIFPLAWIILGEDYQVRTDRLPFLIGVMILTAIAGAALGLTLGTMVQPQQIGLMFSLIFAPLLFLGCAYYPWGQLESIRWFQIVTLINPLTYASEGLRRSMVPQTAGVPFNTLPAVWVLLGLFATIVGFSLYGIHSFRNRVVS
jgi:ABC-2 type transport system permease protein